MSHLDVRAGGSQLRLKKFRIDKMVDHATIAMIAKRASGKSYLTREILYHKKNLPTAVVISRTEKLNRFYGEFIADSFIYDNFDTDILTKIYQRQAKCNSDNKNRLAEGKKEKDDRIMLVMDDCMSSKGTWVKDQNILELFFNGRHHHVSFILTMQYAVGIPPEMRSNFDYIFLLAEDFISNQKRLYEHYAGMFPSRNLFDQVFNQVTDNYGVMAINNRLRASQIRKKVFWYKAQKRENFNVGSKSYIKFHSHNFDLNYDKRLPYIDFSNFGSNIKNIVHVKKIQ